jgi:hypothetical protein
VAVRGVLGGVAAGQRTIVDVVSREQGDDPRER